MKNDGMQESYCYYSNQCYVDIGTFPLPKEMVSFVNFDERIPIEGEAFRAWGFLIYDRPLTESQMDAYDLKPSRNNPDRREELEREAQVVGNWEVQYKTAEDKRITQWNPSTGKYILKEGVLPPELEERHWLVQEWEKIRREHPDWSMETDIF